MCFDLSTLSCVRTYLSAFWQPNSLYSSSPMLYAACDRIRGILSLSGDSFQRSLQILKFKEMCSKLCCHTAFCTQISQYTCSQRSSVTRQGASPEGSFAVTLWLPVMSCQEGRPPGTSWKSPWAWALGWRNPVAELPGDMGKPGSLDSGLGIFSEAGSAKQEKVHPHHLPPLTHNFLCWVSWEVQTSTDPCSSRRARASSCGSVITHTCTHTRTHACTRPHTLKLDVNEIIANSTRHKTINTEWLSYVVQSLRAISTII